VAVGEIVELPEVVSVPGLSEALPNTTVGEEVALCEGEEE